MSLASAFFNSLDPFRTQEASASTTDTAVDWKETPHAHIFQVDLPGLSKDQVKLEVTDARVLQISGERKEEEEDEGKDVTLHRVERARGRFFRRMRLPEDADVEGVKAKMEDGVLTITVKKVEAKKRKEVKVRSVEVGGGKSGKVKKAVLCCGVGI